MSVYVIVGYNGLFNNTSARAASPIANAAQLIADIDPKLALTFLRQPFNRSAIVTAFHHSLTKLLSRIKFVA